MSRFKFCDGSAIAVTLIAIATMTTITLGVAQLVPHDFRQVQAIEYSLAAEQAAWAGIERALLALKSNPYYEHSSEFIPDRTKRPYSNQNNERCYSTPLDCPVGVDRFLGQPVNLTPDTFTGERAQLGKTSDTGYSLSVWHMAKIVGNPNDLADGNPDLTRGAININPIIEHDEAKVLDITKLSDASLGSSSVVLRWQPVVGPDGVNCPSTATFKLGYSWLDSDNRLMDTGSPYDRKLISYQLNDVTTGITIVNPDAERAVRLELRFFATTESGTSTIDNCFARYSLQAGGEDDGVDLGVSIVESTGYYASVRRQIRVMVDRQNGEILDIFDFGVACQVCETEP